jgi:Spy/CpxP family protein refolding chaperone
MRKIVLSLAAAGAALAIASPAAAQYYPAPQPAPYGHNGYNNGFRGNWGQVRELRERIYRVRGQIERLNHRDRLGDRTADRLVHEANELDRRLADRSRGGLDPREAGEIQFRLQRLEQQVQFALADHHPRWGDRDDRWGRRD